MKVDSVNYNGFEKLYELYNHTRGTGKHLDQVLNHIEVTFRMSDLTMIEAFFIKMMLGTAVRDSYNACIIESDDDYNRIFPEESFPDMTPSLKSVVGILPDLEKDTDIRVKPGAMILPAGMISRDVIVTLSGKLIMIMFEQGFAALWNAIFIDSENKPLPEKARPESLDLSNEIIKQRLDNICIRSLVSELYKMMNESLSTIDREADAYIYDNYYKYTMGTLDCALAEIDTPVGQVSFFGNDNASKEIAEIKEKLNKDKQKYTLANDMKFTFTVKSSLYSFIELVLLLPTGSIIDYSDLNINLASDEILVSRDLAKYKTRVINKIKIFNAIKVELSKTKDFPIAKYNFILLNSPMRYNITVTLDKLGLINHMYSKMIKGGFYGNENTSLYRELDHIMGTITEVPESMKKALTN